MDFITHNTEAFNEICVADFTDNIEDIMEETSSLLPIWNEPKTCQLATLKEEITAYPA